MKIKNYLAKLIKEYKEILNFFIVVISYGFVINYMLFQIWGIPFKLLGFPAYGIIYYFLTEEFVVWFRKLFLR